jgi:hypothetical protein
MANSIRKPGSSSARQMGLILLTALLALGVGRPVLAQSASNLVISSPDVSAFPQISFNLEVYDETSNLLTDVQPADLVVIENGQELPVSSITTEQPGLQIILAFNVGGGMAYSFEGVPRFLWLKQTILDWIAQQPAQAPDIYHLITNTGEPQKRVQTAAAISSAVQIYQPDLLNAYPSSLTLTTALDTAAEPLLNPYMKRAILFVTVLPRGESLNALAAQIERAEQMDVRVNVWLVGGTEVGESYAAGQLQDLAARTGGSYQFFSGPEGLPSPEDYLQPIRYLLKGHYRSAIEQAGSYMLKVALRRADQDLLSNERTFQVPYSLPSPIFLNLPGRVDLPFPPVEGALQKIVEQIPATVPLRVLIEFPDGNPRLVQESRLYVDGVLTAQNDTAPFDQFIWSPEVATGTRQYALRVEVEDERGLVGSSIESQIEVGLPAASVTTMVFTPLEVGIRIAAGVGVLGALGLMGLALSRRNRRLRLRQAKASLEARTRPLDRGSAEHMPLFSRSAPARLVRLTEEGTPLPGSQIPLQRREITLGSDAHKAMLVFDSSSVQALHARLVHEGSAFILKDAASVAGTWVNYQPVTGRGQLLQHGDLIHLGRVMLRFELTQVKNLPQVQVLPYTEQK